MNYQVTLIVVEDMERSRAFYRTVLGLEAVADFGANVTLECGIALQTTQSWLGFIGAREEDVRFGGNACELCFEEDDFDGFVKKLASHDIEYVHPVIEHAWGQRVVRFYDPDRHMIEVGENMVVVCKRFLDSGLTVEQTAQRMGTPVEYVRHCIALAENPESV